MDSTEAVRFLGVHFIESCKNFIDEDTYINNLVGDIKFKKNEITNLSLNSQFFNDKELFEERFFSFLKEP